MITHMKQKLYNELLGKLTVSKFSCNKISPMCKSMISLVNVASKVTINVAANAITDGLRSIKLTSKSKKNRVLEFLIR